MNEYIKPNKNDPAVFVHYPYALGTAAAVFHGLRHTAKLLKKSTRQIYKMKIPICMINMQKYFWEQDIVMEMAKKIDKIPIYLLDYKGIDDKQYKYALYARECVADLIELLGLCTVEYHPEMPIEEYQKYTTPTTHRQFWPTGFFIADDICILYSTQILTTNGKIVMTGINYKPYKIMVKNGEKPMISCVGKTAVIEKSKIESFGKDFLQGPQETYQKKFSD